jgi:hypothetical protein
MDRLFHCAFLMCNYDRLSAVPARLNHAAFVTMAALMTDGLTEMYIDSPDMVTITVQCGMDQSLHFSGRLLAAFDVAVCPNLNQHRPLRCYIAWPQFALGPCLKVWDLHWIDIIALDTPKLATT